MDQAFSGERAWRRSRIVQSVAAPSAGQSWATTVPAGHVWDLLGVFASLVSDANAADRSVRLQLGDGNVTFLELPAPAVQAASLTRRYTWLRDVGAYSGGSGLVAPLPYTSLLPGWTIAATVDNIQAGDQWSTVRLLLTDTTARSGPTDLLAIPDLLVEVTATPGA